MYIRKDIRKFIENMPKEMKMPKHWRKFVHSNNTKYNLIIRSGQEGKCTNCGKYFCIEDSKIEKSSLYTCPFCNNKYVIKRSNLKNCFFLYDLAIIDKIDNKLILRYFEKCRKYDYNTKKFKDDIVEYARIIPELNTELVNDRFVKFLWNERVYHTKKIKKWRVFSGMNGIQQVYKAIYLDNIEEKTKGTKYQYAPLKQAIEYLGNNRIDFLKLLKKADCLSFELLMKAGLYNLAINNSEKFNEKGCFEKRFGVSKDYYKFMKRNNITYDELCVLKLINIPNIKIIRNLLKWSNDSIYELEKIGERINLIKLQEYSKTQNKFSLYSYLDYIKNMEELGVPLTNKILLPNNFKKAHDDSVRKIKIVNNAQINQKIIERFAKLQENSYTNDVFFIRPANSLKDLKDEAKQQNNCVYKNYSESYANGKTDIYFLRNVKSPNKSLVTVEVFNKKIRQRFQKGNRSVTQKQDNFLKKWEKNVIQKVA